MMFDCSKCSQYPDLKTLHGCGVESEHTHSIPEMNIACNDRIRINTCPVPMIGHDVMSLSNIAALADNKLSVAESLDLPAPWVEAFGCFVSQKLTAQAERQAARSKK